MLVSTPSLADTMMRLISVSLSISTSYPRIRQPPGWAGRSAGILYPLAGRRRICRSGRHDGDGATKSYGPPKICRSGRHDGDGATKSYGVSKATSRENRRLDSTPGCSLSGRSAGILYPLAGRRRICRSGRHDGDGATKSYGVSKATSRENRRLDSTPGCSLSGRSAGILYPLAGRRRICRSGRHDGDGATKSYGVSKATSRENRRLDSTPGALSPAARPAFFIRWRAAEEFAGRGATMATARRRATGSARQRAAKTAGWIVPLAALSPAARPAFFIRWRAAEEFAGRGATMATARRRATGSARQRAAKTAGWIVPLAALSGRSAGILYPLAGRRRICRSGRHDGDGATKSYGVSKATSRENRRLDSTPGCSLSGRSAGILYPLAGRRRICRSGRHDGDGATKSYGVSKATSRENRRLDSTPGCSLSGRSAGILYPLAGRRRICRSGRHDGDGATKSYGVSKATSRENRRLDSTPGCSLSGRSAGILYPLAGRRRICRSGRHDGDGATKSYGVSKATSRENRRLDSTPGCSLSGRSAGILYPLAGRRRICRSGRHDGDGATKSYGVSKATSRENRRLDSTPGCSLSGRSAGILYPLAGRRRICRSGRHDGDGATK